MFNRAAEVGLQYKQNKGKKLFFLSCLLTHLAYIANGKKTCYIVQQFHWAIKRDVTLRHL